MIFGLLRHSSPAVLCASCVMFGIPHAALAQQTSNRLVQCNDPAQITDPVLISNVAVAGKTVECGLFIKPPSVLQPVTAFQASSDWLQQMTISLVNRTNKTIVSGTVSLLFLDNAVDCRTQTCPLEQMHLGQMPAVDAYDGRTGRPLKQEQSGKAPLNWEPGQTLTLGVGDFISDIEAKLSNYEPIGEASKVSVHVGPFFFQDGMRWAAGAYSVPVPETPGKFRALKENYFPGQRGSNWPPGYSQ